MEGTASQCNYISAFWVNFPVYVLRFWKLIDVINADTHAVFSRVIYLDAMTLLPVCPFEEGVLKSMNLLSARKSVISTLQDLAPASRVCRLLLSICLSGRVTDYRLRSSNR